MDVYLDDPETMECSFIFSFYSSVLEIAILIWVKITWDFHSHFGWDPLCPYSVQFMYNIIRKIPLMSQQNPGNKMAIFHWNQRTLDGEIARFSNVTAADLARILPPELFTDALLAGQHQMPWKEWVIFCKKWWWNGGLICMNRIWPSKNGIQY